MSAPIPPDEPVPRPLSLDRRTGWVMLLLVLFGGSWLVWEIHRTIGLNAPRFWELLRDDRVFDLAMLDFFLTAGWALLVLVERSNRRGWQFWVPLFVFCAVPSLGIALFLLLRRGSKGDVQDSSRRS
ncbi:MAG TPA: hypothetical protein VFT74_17430 [Isosphaeraceae bacterium]|nr:hypothetical protein [Isosphaeraceae bacterium]